MEDERLAERSALDTFSVSVGGIFSTRSGTRSSIERTHAKIILKTWLEA